MVEGISKALPGECSVCGLKNLGREFWEDGCFAQTIGDQVATDVSQYTCFHEDGVKRPEQLRLI